MVKLILIFFTLAYNRGYLCARDLFIGNVASIPRREKMLEITINSIINQIDILNVYLNNYKHIPNFLKNKKINIIRSQDFGDLGSNGKFFATDKVEGYYFTLDDDIIYNKNYVNYLVDSIDKYKRKAIVGLHGSIFKNNAIDFYKDRFKWNFQSENDTDRIVNLLGTGVLAYHTSTLSINISDFTVKNKSDVQFCVICKKKNIPFICLKRDALYCLDQMDKDYHLTLCHQNAKNHSLENFLLKENMPWEITFELSEL
jgi:hypothetical protein